MATITIQNKMIGAGISNEDARTLTADNAINASESIPAGIAGTAGGGGAMTVSAGHGYTTGTEIVNLYWTEDGVAKKRYGCTITVSPETVITLAGGTGDTLPTSGEVVICKSTEIDLAFNGTNLVALSIRADVGMVVTLEDAEGVEKAILTTANGGYTWDNGGSNTTNPVTGDSIVKATCYNTGTTAGTCQIIAAYDND